MMTVIALAVVGASVVFAAIAAITTRSLLAPIPFVLDVWIAAGLLRLSQQGSWTAILGAAALIGIRKLVASALPTGRHVP